jgi:hypothetical protein
MNDTASRTSLEPIEPIEQAARRAERRLRMRRALAWAAKAFAVALVAVAVTLILRKLWILQERPTRILLAVYGASVFVAAGIGYAQRLPRRAGAVALDRFHGLADRLSSALSFSELPSAERTPFMQAAIDDALEYARNVDPRRAVPMEKPRELTFLLVMIVTVIGIALFEIRFHKPVLTARTIDAVDVTQDDLDAMREFLRDVDQRMQTDEAKAATQEFNQLIEDLANKRLDRTEAFRRMQQLEDKLLQGREADAKALEEALKKMGEELKKSEMTKPAGEALENKNLADAEKAMHDLARKLRESGKGVDKAQLEKMREALKKAGEDQAKRAEALAQKREELKQDLLKQKQKMGDGGTDQEKSLLQKKERELERLDREHEQQQKTQRELDRLDRELQKAAEDLMKDLGMSANDLDNAAQDINRMGKQEMSQEEKEQLRQKLQELREMLRQQSQGGQGQMQRLRVFQQRARGQGQSGQGQGGQQGQGQGQDGQGQQGQGGQQAGNGGTGQQGQGQGQGQGKGQGGGETWILGPNGEKILMITASKGSGQGGSQPGGGGQANKGPGWGTGHDNNVQGGATNPKVGVQDTQVAGNDTGQGGSRSEVILGAAERGFASRGYQKVYREYHTVAEEALNKDEIPGGYRFYVRRYFQLIRPREEGGGSAPAPAPAPPPGPPTP